ncbi:unnamed protein product [Adineta ricciae]|uniref:G-protein coupled receptors family 1 profile domain-containing protein n=1 Tax=Adineta ricciae TaxID=249248 RepID=A0A813S9J2_ADIRI|nr:unnamed protein product [Adineta ricciae]CAF0793147.1 unnamed protein product [Adineta ricciae]
MSSSNVTNSYADALSAITTTSVMFTRYWCITMFIVGFIGHLLNLCVFTRPTLRTNPCARYFMASTIAGFGVILIVLPIRVLQFGYGRSLFIPSVFLCKFLTFLFSWLRILPCWFIALASADRFWCTSSSVTFRGWNSIRVSNHLIPLTTIFIAITQVPLLIFYTVSSQPVVCLGQPNLFQQVNGFFILVIWSMIPFVAMLIFGVLTIRNVRRSIRGVADVHADSNRYRRTRFIDRQLIQIILIQSLLFMATSAAGSIGGTFNILDDNSRKDALVLAKQGLIGNVLSFVGLLGPCISFYLCTLSSQLFRHEFLAFLRLRQENPPEQVAHMIPMEQINA